MRMAHPPVIAYMNHYDADGHSADYSVDGLLDGQKHYDADGFYAGFSTPNIITWSAFHGADGQEHPGMFDNGNAFWNDHASSDRTD